MLSLAATGGVEARPFWPGQRNPLSQSLGDEFGAVVGTNMHRDAAQDEGIGEHIDDVDNLQLSFDPDGDAFACATRRSHQRKREALVANIRNFLPLCVRSVTKSQDQTWSRYSGRSRIHELSFNQSRLRLVCLDGSFVPSNRHIRSARLTFTMRPA